jgi:outer membrane protein assembly factor BamB
VPGSDVVGVVGGTVVVRAPGGTGGTGVLGVDLVTGTVRWTHHGSCEQVPVGDAPAGATGSADRLTDRPDDLVVCVEQLSTGGVDGGHVLPLAAHVVDPATGDVLRTVDLGPRTSFATVGADVVTLGIAEDGHAESARWSLLTGEQRWTYRSPDVLPAADGWGSSIGGTVVQLDLGAWTLTLDADTGRRIPRVPARDLVAEPTWGPLRLADGATATSRSDGGGSPETVVREADGSRRVTVPGLLVLPTLDDASAPDRLFVVRGDDPARPQQIAAVDAATGATRWTVTAPTGRAAVVQGLLLVRDDAGVTALDARTGTVRWTSTADDAPRSGGSLVSDGRRVLIVEGVPRDPTLVARDVVSGAVVWSRPHPGDGAALVLLPDGTVVADGSGELVALRPARG